MQRDDLLLFAWQPPRQVLLFPLASRVGKVRHAARKISGKRGDDASMYWRQLTAANRKHLERVGLPSDKVEAELRSFFDAVQGELNRMAYEGTGGSGGAA